MSMPSVDQDILKIIKAGLYLSLVTPLLMFSSLLYPFVTSKVFFFRILIEILAGLYFYIALKYKEYRPRFSLLLAGLLIYSAILLISGAFGVDWNLSFWGDLERMGGIFTWLHFVAYFIILTSLLKSEKDWNWMITSSVIVSAIMTIYGLAQKFDWWHVYNAGGRIDSITGNPSYFAAYLFFQIFFIFLLFFKTKKLFWRASLASLAALQFLSLFYTGTRGAYLGLGAGFLIFVLLYIIFSTSKRGRLLLGGGVIILLAVFIGLFLNSKIVVDKVPSLTRILNISLGDATLNTRFIAWSAAWRGFKEHPALGVGPENFAIIFDKYFQPSFYTFTPTQTYFDRAHNTVFDLLATSGILGLLSYLAIFGILIFYLAKNFKSKIIDLKIFSGSVALLVAYFIQNIFVFDSINSYIPFILVLALVEYWNFQKVEPEEKNKQEKKLLLSTVQKAILACVFFGAIFAVYFYNLQPLWAAQQVKLAEYFIQKENNLEKGVDYYKQALSYQTPLDRDIRTQLATAVELNIAKYGTRLSSEKINDFFDFAISEMKKNIAHNVQDNFFNLKLGELYNLRSDYKKIAPDEAESYLQSAIKSSPGRLTGYYVLSQSKLLRKDYLEAEKIVKTAIVMNPFFRESYWHLSRVYYLANRDVDAMKAVKMALLLGYNVKDAKDIEALINIFYGNKDYRTVAVLLSQLIGLKPNEPALLGRLSMAYAAFGDNEHARFYINKVVEMDESYKEEVDLFLKKLDEGALVSQ